MKFTVYIPDRLWEQVLSTVDRGSRSEIIQAALREWLCGRYVEVEPGVSFR